MKRIIFVMSFLPLLFSGTSCIKDGCQGKTIQSESGTITAYAATNGITGTTHSSGLYYQIITPGSGQTPALTSQVTARYTGKLLDGTVFDSQTGTPVGFRVDGTIPGWQIALQMLQEGGKIKIIVPSALAYGCDGRGSIPPNAILYFEIELVDVI